MKKKFNITGCCYPDRHYMVNITSKLEEIKALVDDGEYFVINRARQYGKTTTLKMLKSFLEKDYVVLALDFQDWGNADFQDEERFAVSFADSILRWFRDEQNDSYEINKIALSPLELIVKKEIPNVGLRVLFQGLQEFCDVASKRVILMIDEVDSATNNSVFLDFLAKLRSSYLHRDRVTTFQSVILAGIYDIKNLKLKLRPDEQHRYNSPWNIATDFKVDMSFSKADIGGMLQQYEQEYHTGMDIVQIAGMIYDYSSGYPYLVSYICKLMDEEIAKGDLWTAEGIVEAVKVIIKGPNTLYDDMIKHILEYTDLYAMLHNILFNGENYPYQIYNQSIDIGRMFGFIVENQGSVAIANRIFETQLYNYFIMTELQKNDKEREALPDKNQFIENGQLNMDQVMYKFYEYYTSLLNDNDSSFSENQGRKLFLMFLRPIINGTGNYYVEDQSRNKHRTDVIVDYKGKQYIIELKIWHGEEYQNRGKLQLMDYMDAYHQDKGYLLSFAFHANKQTGVKEIRYADKTILEVVV